MPFLNKTVFIFSIFLVLLLLAAGRTLSLGGINPNLPLIFLLFVSFLKRGFFSILSLGFLVLFVSVIFMPFWLSTIFLIFLITIFLKLVSRFFSGNDFLDFSIMIISGSVFFYLLAKILGGGFLSPVPILKEAIYNVIFGTAVWIFSQSIKRKRFSL